MTEESAVAEVVDGTATEEPSTDEQPAAVAAVREEAPLVIRDGSTAIIAASTPEEKVEQATAIANALSEVINKQGLRTKVGRHKVVKEDGTEVWEDKYHVDVEGWQTLATLLDIVPHLGWCRPVIDPATGRPRLTEYEVERYIYPKGTKKNEIKNGTANVESVEKAIVKGYDWEARIIAVRNGIVVGEAEAMCTRTEEKWRTDPDFALRSMAQTRATSRAIAAAARWIVTLAGFSGTPAEEMSEVQAREAKEAEANGNGDRKEFGPALSEVSEDGAAKLVRAVAFILNTGDGPNEAKAAELLKELEKRFGYFPNVCGTAIGAVAKTLRELEPTS